MQGLRIKTPEDIQKLPGYISKIDPERNPLSHIITSYYISPFEIPCGLCGQPHMDGKIVAIVSEAPALKVVANIGHVCGKKRFGDKYIEESRRHNETTEKPQLIQRLTEGQAKIEALLMPLQELRNRAEDIKRRQSKFIQLFPETYQALVRRAQEAKADIYASVERTQDEIDDLRAVNRFQSREELLIKQEYIGSVSGHRLPSINWSLERGVMGVLLEANKFAELSIRSLQMKDLIKWANWLDDFDEKREGVESAVREGEQFFTIANFRLFVHLPAPISARERLREITLKDLDAHRSTIVEAKATPTPTRRTRALPRPALLTPKQLRRMTGSKKAW